jgi:4-hydroxy-tetrahydrodipicolinate reductase
MKLLLIGHGRMGKLVEELAPSYGCEIAGIVTSRAAESAIAQAGHADVAVDFSAGPAVAANLAALAAKGLNVVIGTTGWHDPDGHLKAIAERAGIGVFASANFSLGMSIFQIVVEDAARRFAARPDVGAWIHESHHSAKKDAPSGTALMLEAVMEQAGYSRGIDVSSTRAGSIPGTHVVGFDAQSETVMLTHTVRDRAVFARGALEAAKWLKGRRGWFTMRDLVSNQG